MSNDITETYFDAVRHDDLDTVRRLLKERPSLVNARWRGRGRPDGKIRSLGESPYNQHSWIDPPIEPGNPDDPRYTSTPLHWTRTDAMVQLLVENGADVNADGTSGELELPKWFLKPLWRAAHDGRIASVRLLVERGADVNVINPDGCNQALKTAVENGRAEVVSFLLAQGACPDIHSAAMLGLVEQVKRLIASDPQLLEHQDEHGRSPLDAATLMDSFRVLWPQNEAHDQAAAALVAQGARMELPHAASLGWVDRIKEFIKADPGSISQHRPVAALLTGSATFETALEAAQRRRHTHVVELLAGRLTPHVL